MILYKLRLLFQEIPPKIRWEPAEEYGDGWLNGYVGKSKIIFFQIHPIKNNHACYDLRCHLPNFVEYPAPSSSRSTTLLKTRAEEMFNEFFTELIFGESE